MPTDMERYRRDPEFRATVAAQQKRRRDKRMADPVERARILEEKRLWKQQKRVDPAYRRAEYDRDNARQRERYAADSEFRAKCLAQTNSPTRRRSKNMTRNEQYARDPAYREACINKARERNTGMSAEMVAALTALQGGTCAVCEQILIVEMGKRRLAAGQCADHCHVTGQPRGLLCGGCNKTLGHYENSLRARKKIALFEEYLNNTPVMRLRAAADRAKY